MILTVSGLGIIFALLGFLWIWHSDAKEREELEDAWRETDDFNSP